MKPGIVRVTPPSTTIPDAPLWMRHIFTSASALADFYTDLTRSIQRCESLIADLLSKGDLDAARIMLGKREALTEQRFLLDAYRREQPTQKEKQDAGTA